MKINKTNLLLLTIVTIAAFFRFFRLDSTPQGFFSDEAAVGYNAYSIVKTGRDEFGKFMPLFFKSFGEGKLPLYVYQAVPFVFLLGPTKLAVRFPGALLGSLTILAWYFFLLESLKLSKIKKSYHQVISLASAFSLSLMPWHIHFSRGVFGQESLFWVSLGSFLLLKGLRKNDKLITFFSFLSFICSLLIYHSPKVILPLWIPLLLLSSKKTFKTVFNHTFIGTTLLVFIWGLVTFNPLGMQRAKGVSVFSQYSGVSAKLHESITEEGYLKRSALFARIMHNKVESYGRDIAGRYLSHFNPDFLFVSGDPIRPRYRVPNQPQVFIIFLPFLLLGTYLSFKRKLYLPIIFLLLAPLPASMSFETPSTVRALFMTPALATLIGLGLISFFNSIIKANKPIMLVTTLSLLALAITYQTTSYFNSYFSLNNVHKPYAWQFGYKDLVNKVVALQDNYDQVIVTGMGGPPYIFFAFYQQYDPTSFQEQVNHNIGETDPFGFIHITGFDKYKFPKQPCPFDINAKKTLFVCKENGEGIDRKFLIDTIYFNDQTEAFTIFDPEHEN